MVVGCGLSNAVTDDADGYSSVLRLSLDGLIEDGVHSIVIVRKDVSSKGYMRLYRNRVQAMPVRIMPVTHGAMFCMSPS